MPDPHCPSGNSRHSNSVQVAPLRVGLVLALVCTPPSHGGSGWGLGSPPATLSGVAGGLYRAQPRGKLARREDRWGPGPSVLPTKVGYGHGYRLLLGMSPVGPEQPGQTTTAPVSELC